MDDNKFQKPFSREAYLEIIRTLLPSQFKEDIQRIALPDSLKVVESAQLLGMCELEDEPLAVFEVEHSAGDSARISISNDAFKIMRDHDCIRALVAFKSKMSEQWRLSLMTVDYRLDDKGKVTTDISNPRRYSFLLGPGAKVHTPAKQLAKAVTDFNNLSSLFSLEVVNEDFYAEIALLFTELVGGTRKIRGKTYTFPGSLVLPSDATREVNQEFVVRLIGRLVFCWFLKGKTPEIGGQPLMPEGLLSSVAASKNDGYYEKIVEKIFFECLNKVFEERSNEYQKNEFALIPYLNGGLFDIHLEDYVGRGKKIPDDWLSRLFVLFENYNFTIDENTVTDIDLSIDPEMLGRIFENLLAEINPETGESARKSTGSYYTPREIVEYMIDEALTEALCTSTSIEKEKIAALVSSNSLDDEDYPLNPNEVDIVLNAIDNFKIIDPAAGSGAFPIGILQKILMMLKRIDPEATHWYEKQIDSITDEGLRDAFEQHFEKNKLDWIRKSGIIRKVIYGVDIQPIATEVSKLRCFLTLVVDAYVDDSKPNRGVEPLPNLEFKFVTANSLIALGESEELQIFMDRDIASELKKIRSRWFNAKTARTKEILTNKYLKLIGQGQLDQREHVQQLSTFNPFNPSSISCFFDPEHMFGVSGGFDIVIGNPPYVSTKGQDEKQKKILKDQYGFADDLYSHFIFLGDRLLAPDGVLSFITSKTYWTIQTKRNLRHLLLSRKIVSVFDTANPFKATTVNTAVVTYQNLVYNSENEFDFLDGRRDLINPVKYKVKQNLYGAASNEVIFEPSVENLSIFYKYNDTIKDLLTEWWPRIYTSKEISKNAERLEQYRNSLKPGDVSLLGLITEGGQGLATANNGKYIGVLEGTKEADRIRETRLDKFYEFISKRSITQYGETKDKVSKFLNKLSEIELRNLFDSSKEEYGRDIFGQGYLYRIVTPDEVKDVSTMTEEEKSNGIPSGCTYVPYDKGDKDGNRWCLRTPYYIDWSFENVSYMKKNSGKKGQGMPVVRNPQFYFRSGFTWTLLLNEQSELLKARLKEPSVIDVNAMSLFSCSLLATEKFIVCLLNSYYIFNFQRNFLNASSAFQINDARQIPIIIPTSEQLVAFEKIFDDAYSIKVQQYDGEISDAVAEKSLVEIQEKLDQAVNNLYAFED